METAVEHLVAAVEALPPELGPGEVVVLFAAADRLLAHLSAAIDRVDPAGDGAVSVAQWLRHRARRGAAEAAVLVKRATRLRSCPIVHDAWLDGRLATAEVDAIVAHLTESTQALFSEHAPELVPSLEPLSVRHTEAAMRRWAAYAEAVVNVEPREASRRAVSLSAGVDGSGVLSGRLDPGGLQVVNAALDAATTPDLDGEPTRTRGERRADALVAVARHFLDHADVAATSRRSRPDVTVVVTLDDLGRGLGRDIDGAVVDAATLRPLLCDAGVHRVVTDGGSIVLDAGRTTRTVSHHLFSALSVRDGGCRFPGCDRPVSWCEAHHVVPWQHGGATDPSNLVLLCWRHHHDFAHHPQWQLKLLPDATVEVTTVDGRVLTSPARPPPSRRPEGFWSRERAEIRPHW